MFCTKPEIRSHKCKPCIEGFHQEIGAQTFCKACQPGTFQGLKGKAECFICREGFYQDELSKEISNTLYHNALLFSIEKGEILPCNNVFGIIT